MLTFEIALNLFMLLQDEQTLRLALIIKEFLVLLDLLLL
jgi:hypothetical protein